ncbi:CDP-alcohol phosphatidyltransferase [Ancylostoma caninum]|uniref:CDP-alcohol phosphatidyltransferase n=1 Tax=Ancylostoma caninum TaxID=29170 RepID=A0A368FRK2_ANCCA|nr:CDP-alcohol phosphatidyltransferase [Ancylostoma caninum]
MGSRILSLVACAQSHHIDRSHSESHHSSGSFPLLSNSSRSCSVLGLCFGCIRIIHLSNLRRHSFDTGNAASNGQLIDGKQARRTGAASPLGELFDHGCDSISQVFVTLNVAYALRLGDVRCGTFFIVIVAISLFYCAHWSTYCTGQLSFSRFDVTEAQVTIILLLLITAVCGPNIWTIGILGYQLRHLLLFFTLIGSLYQCSSYLDVIFTGGVGRNGSTVAGTSVLFPVCPLLACIVPFAMIYSKSRSAVFDENITLFVMCFGAVAAKATNRLIVGHMSRSELVLWDWIYLGPIALMLNQYYDFVICERKLLLWVTCYTYTSLLIYCCVITRQICYHMKIYCFKVPPRR